MSNLKGLDALIAALTILRKYGNPYSPTHCAHDELTIIGIDPATVSAEDTSALDELGFFVSGEGDEAAFKSFRFGSA
jgi:hypothetical protein